MKRFLAQFILFYWESYVRIDWTVITKLGRIYYAPFAFIRAIIYWLVCPIALPEFLIKRTKMYQEFLKIMEQKNGAVMFN
jgi:hypothetical protein